MNPFLLIALAAGAYVAYTRLRAAPAPAPQATPALPEGTLGEVPASAEGAANLAQWEALDFDVDVFPPGVSRQSIEPPRTAYTLSVAPGCSAIAVGHGFWERVEDFARSRLDGGQTTAQVYEQAMDELFSVGISAGPKAAAWRCVDEDTVAGRLLAAEIHDRIRALARPFISARDGGSASVPEPQDDTHAGGTWTPVERNPSMVDALVHFLAGGYR